MSMDEHDIEWRCECGHTTPDYWLFCVGCGQYRYYGEEAENGQPRERLTVRQVTAASAGMSPAQTEDTTALEELTDGS